MTPKVCFVGEANPYGADPDMALYPLPERAAGHRLMTLLGLPRHVYMDADLVARRNLCPTAWSIKQARENLRVLAVYHPPAPVVVLLGTRCSAAFEATSGMPLSAFASRSYVTTTFASLPHPSGRNTVWNSPVVRDRAVQFLRELVPDLPWGSAHE